MSSASLHFAFASLIEDFLLPTMFAVGTAEVGTEDWLVPVDVENGVP